MVLAAVLLLQMVLLIVVVQGAPHNRPQLIGDNVLNYLMNYGYLPMSDMETGNLRTDKQLNAAIRQLQTYAGLSPTGVLDDKTRKLLKRPRCGLPDVLPQESHSRSKRYTLQGQRWQKTDLTWRLDNGSRSGPANDHVRRELSRALEVWSRHSRLKFRETLGEADIVVQFASRYHNDGYPFDGPGQVLAHAFFPGSGRGGDAHFDDEERWAVNAYVADGETSLFAVAAHEFGHSLGLAHSSKEGALMNPWYQAFGEDFDLPDDDRYAIQQLYGRGGADGELATLPPMPTPRPTRPPDHKPTSRPTRRPSSGGEHGGKPSTCDTSYDAVSVIRGELFIFKGKYFWRISRDGLKSNYPVEIERFWYGMPKNLSHVDAVYERQDMKIVFFIGQYFWVFEANNLLDGYPQPISVLGLPMDIEQVDGAMVWGHNRKTYLYSGTMYWRLDEDGKAELDYPRDMSMWRGVPYGIDSVFQWTDGKTYFFKGKVFWRFDDMRMRVESKTPSLSAPFWMGCPTKITGEERMQGDPIPEQPPVPSSASIADSFVALLVIILVLPIWRKNVTC